MEHGCGGCSAAGNCGGCDSGCGGCSRGELILCKEEARILLELGQYAFLPIIQRVQDGERHYEATPDYQRLMTEQVSALISSLEQKRLITVDSEIPLKNTEYGPLTSGGEVRCGSIALTLQGQELLDWLAPSDCQDFM